MSWLKEKYEETKKEIKTDWEQKRKADKETRRLSREEYYKERQRQQIELARKKAVLESQKRERELKAKFAPRPKPTSQTTSNPNSFQMSWQPSGINSPSYFEPVKNKKDKKKKKKGDWLW